jgi:hypothetical protein
MAAKVTDAREALGIINKSYVELQEKMQRLTEIKVNDKAFETFIAGLGFDLESNKGKALSPSDQLKALFQGEGMGANFDTAKGTAFGAVNAISQYTDWMRPTRLTKAGTFKSEGEARLNAQWFGSGATLKDNAVEAALKIAA